MSQNQKVVWFEGMNLDPHHFQQWDRYHTSALASRVRAVAHYDWGVLEVDVDKDALVNGQFHLLRCRGVTPDGLAFSIPTDDPAPRSRAIQDYFAATENELGVFLVIPVERERGNNCRLEGESAGRETRYVFQKTAVTDDNSGADEREIGVGRTNFQIRFTGESYEDFSTLKIAEIVRTQDGSFALSRSFIPSCLTIDASENLMAITRRLLELMITKSASLGARKHFKGQTDYTSQDITIFWALQTLNMNIPLLNHYHTISKGHPEGLYLGLLALAGQLTTFSPELNIHPRELPTYDHNGLSKCFNLLDSKIRTLLDSIAPSANYLNIPLEKKSESLYTAHVSDAKVFHEMKIFLRASGDLPEKKMIDEIPTNLRVASPDQIDAVLSSFQTALAIKYASVPPSVLPMTEGSYYFQLLPSGPFWDAIVASQGLAVFVPSDLRGIVIEAVAV